MKGESNLKIKGLIPAKQALDRGKQIVILDAIHFLKYLIQNRNRFFVFFGFFFWGGGIFFPHTFLKTLDVQCL